MFFADLAGGNNLLGLPLGEFQHCEEEAGGDWHPDGIVSYSPGKLCPGACAHSPVHCLVEHVLDGAICRTSSGKIFVLCNMVPTL